MRFNKIGYIRYVYKELTFVRSIHDLGILNDKFPLWIRIVIENRKDTAKPLILQLEPTNICNLRCIMCPQYTSKRKKGFMDFGLFQKVVDDAVGFGVKRVWLYAQGEPLLHPRIIDMVGYLKKKKLGVDITTNGMLLDSVKARALFNSNMDSADYITFSVMGRSKEVHESIMKGADHDLVESNILSLMELRRQRKISGPIVQTKLYSMPENLHEIAAYEKFWRGKVDRVLPVTPISHSFSKTADNDKITLKRSFCTQAWDRITVYWNGDMTLCNNDTNGENVAGNLQAESIKEVWYCDKYMQFRKMHREKQFGNVPLCARCDI